MEINIKDNKVNISNYEINSEQDAEALCKLILQKHNNQKKEDNTKEYITINKSIQLDYYLNILNSDNISDIIKIIEENGNTILNLTTNTDIHQFDNFYVNTIYKNKFCWLFCEKLLKQVKHQESTLYDNYKNIQDENLLIHFLSLSKFGIYFNGLIITVNNQGIQFSIKIISELIIQNEWLNAAKYLIDNIIIQNEKLYHYIYYFIYPRDVNTLIFTELMFCNDKYWTFLTKNITKINDIKYMHNIIKKVIKFNDITSKNIIKSLYNKNEYNEIIYLEILQKNNQEKYEKIIKSGKYNKNKIIPTIEEWLENKDT